MHHTTQRERVRLLREILAREQITMMPCCYDGLTAKLIERAGFEATFMSGFGVSAVHGFPDVQLLSFGEMAQAATYVCNALDRIPCIGDGDTGYGNAINVKRTVKAYAQAGMAGIMIEDQVSPKRCGHTAGKAVVSREEAYARIRAAVDARNEGGFDIVILARTDARHTHSPEEAIERCREFVRLGADITFFEAPRDIQEMRNYCTTVPGPKMANMVENGLTPILKPKVLQELGYKLVIYPLTLLSSSIKTMETALSLLQSQDEESTESVSNVEMTGNEATTMPLRSLLSDFEHVKDVVGFTQYYEEENRYKRTNARK